MIKKALPSQIDKIIAITKACAIDMQQKGIFQWNNHYPSKKAFVNDCQLGELYVYLLNDEILGCITISTHKDA